MFAQAVALKISLRMLLDVAILFAMSDSGQILVFGVIEGKIVCPSGVVVGVRRVV
jgi:hypothetical protein